MTANATPRPWTPPAGQSEAEQVRLALEYAHDALEHWGEGETGMAIVANARRIARAALQRAGGGK